MLFRKKIREKQKVSKSNSLLSYLRKEYLALFKIKIPNRCFGRASLNASLTLEAALVLPIFLYFAVGTLSFLNLMGSAGVMAGSIQDTAKQIGVYAYAVKSGSSSTKAAADCVSVLYAESCLRKHAGNKKELSLIGSSFLSKGDYIDLVAVWRADFEVPLFSFGQSRIVQRGCVRAWTGRDFRKNNGSSEGKAAGGSVYVTETGTVYHKDRSCTYLKLSIRKVSYSVTGKLRNRYGEKYYACSCCRSGVGATVYITDTGNRYHADRSCSGLKRTIHKIKESEVSHLPSCSKCGG